jgi:ribosome biogenesis SPOUT family RNA methylase Rps3
MAIFTKPENLNGAELIAELGKAGLSVEEVIDLGDGTIELNVSDTVKAKAIVDKHNGTIVAPELTVEQKLHSVGLNLNDLKTALGL